MKNILLLALLIGFTSCNSRKEKTESVPVEKESAYPEPFSKVLDAHGSLARWNEFKTLSYTLVKGEDQKETYTVDLHSRKDRLETGTATMGYDGKEVWLNNPDSTYTGNPEFYHNLMFYFYAMPFVLADSGIMYEETEALQVADTSYPGLKIRFKANVGASSNDEYYLYYDSQTYRMRWLGYTATFGAAKKSDRINYISYADGSDINGIRLPASLRWYATEEGVITQPGNRVSFENVQLLKEAKPDSFYTR